jgi:D-sedoheptulose 7-phosphate isomerase
VSHYEERVKQLFGHAIEIKMMMAEQLSQCIGRASERLVQCLLNDGKILLCGNGCSAANALQFSSLMLNHGEIERPPLPALSLCTDLAVMSALTQEGQVAEVFARQIQALGSEGDVLILITTSGNPGNLLHALHAAHERGIDVIALTGRDGGILATHLGPEDIELRVPGDTSAQINEMHLFILNSFIDIIEQSLFGQLVGL